MPPTHFFSLSGILVSTAGKVCSIRLCSVCFFYEYFVTIVCVRLLLIELAGTFKFYLVVLYIVVYGYHIIYVWEAMLVYLVKHGYTTFLITCCHVYTFMSRHVREL